jgi:hypothetical protein
MQEWFAEGRLEDVSVERRTLVVHDPTAVDNVLGLRSWARAAMARGMMNDADVQRWETLYDEVVTDERFRWSVSFFITRGRKPGQKALASALRRWWAE